MRLVPLVAALTVCALVPARADDGYHRTQTTMDGGVIIPGSRPPGDAAEAPGEEDGPSGESSEAGEGGSDQAEAGAAAAAKQASGQAASRRSAAASAAARMAQSLKALGGGGDAGALGAPGKTAGPSAGAHPPGRTAAPSPAPPSDAGAAAGPAGSAEDVSAWFGPYQALAASRGLVPYKGADGRVAFRHKDGRPASAAEVADLRAAAAREPGALAKYPDYFSVIPRPHYERLRDDMGTNPDRPAYKDMTVRPDERRDLVWERSCERVSGDCNPHAVESSYKKDEFVRPETVKSLWDSILEMMDQVREEHAAPDGLSKLSGPRPFSAAPPEPDGAAEARGEAQAAAEGTAAASAAAAASAVAQASRPARAFAAVKAYLGRGSGRDGGFPFKGLAAGTCAAALLAAAWAKSRG